MLTVYCVGIANFWKAPNEPNKSEEKIRVGNSGGEAQAMEYLPCAYMCYQG